ncbi:MAG TPA: hypothetical protein VLQ65_02720 [Saliniramus sp.]|nr:hypothetical protein [Saliniramus sp.]
MDRFISRGNSGAKVIAAASITELEDATGSTEFHTPSFKKATFGFFGSITFLYATVFFLSTVI